MAHYHLSLDADIDLEELYEYSIIHFGEVKADQYISGLISKFEVIANNNLLGTDRSKIKENLRLSTYESHSIYYLTENNGIYILRILGAGQDPLKQFNAE